MTLKPVPTSGRSFIYRSHTEPRVQLHVPEEGTFHIPLKSIDVARSTHTKSVFNARKTYSRLLECPKLRHLHEDQGNQNAENALAKQHLGQKNLVTS